MKIIERYCLVPSKCTSFVEVDASRKLSIQFKDKGKIVRIPAGRDLIYNLYRARSHPGLGV